MARLFTLAIAICGVLAAPQAVKRTDDPGCISSVPDHPDPNVVNLIYLAAVAKQVNTKVMEATFETCLQESNCCNLNCGDQDSLGAFQQRKTQGWGTAAQITNVTHSANSFITQAISLAAAHPDYSPDQIAQGVQEAQAGNLYGQHLAQARQLIQQAADRTGVAWGSNKPSGGGSSSPSKPTKSTPPAHPTPPPSGGGESSGGGSSSGSGCKKYTVKAGDYCTRVAKHHGISTSNFEKWNPSINAQCTNLKLGKAYCVSKP